MKLVLLDNSDQYTYVIDKITGDYVVFSIDHSVRYLCDKDGVQCLDIKALYDHDELWELYPQIKQISRGIVDYLEQYICSQGDVDQSLYKLNFYDYYYCFFKMSVDQVYLYQYLLRKVHERYKINILYCLSEQDIYLGEQLLIESSVNLLAYVGGQFCVHNGVRCENININKSRQQLPRGMRFSFGQYDYGQISHHVSRQIKTLLVGFLFSLSNRISILKKKMAGRIDLISVHCKEIDSMCSELKLSGLGIFFFTRRLTHVKFRKPRIMDSIVASLLKDKNFNRMAQVNGVMLSPIILPLFHLLYKNQKRLIKEYIKIKNTVIRIQPKAVIVQTLSPFEPYSLLFHKACAENNTPLYCWMHGGYGAYYSLPGYDVTDYRLTKNHISYSKAVVDSVKSESSVLCMQNENMDYNIISLGSPYLDRLYADYLAPHNHTKKILFTLPGQYERNHYYFGYNRPYEYLNGWDENLKIINELAKFEDIYEITIKDYPSSSQKGLLLDYLKRIGSTRIRVVTYERTYHDCLVESDLLIYTWISTSFIEGLYTNADILVYDNSDMTSQSLDILKKNNMHASEIDGFLLLLRGYLVEGRFNIQYKNGYRGYFLNQSSVSNKADDLIREIERM